MKSPLLSINNELWDGQKMTSSQYLIDRNKLRIFSLKGDKMKLIALNLLFTVACSRPDRMKDFIQRKILPPEMQGYALNGY